MAVKQLSGEWNKKDTVKNFHEVLTNVDNGICIVYNTGDRIGRVRLSMNFGAVQACLCSP